MRSRSAVVLSCLVGSMATAIPAFSQQPETLRYDLYAGFSDLNTPGQNNINQMGLHLQMGVNLSKWTSAGVDYSFETGTSSLTPGLLSPLLQKQLAAELPAGYQLKLPYHASIQSFSGGGQMVVRHFRRTTLHVRPVLAAFRINASPRPEDPVSVVVAAQLAPQGHLVDWFGAYGAGGDAEFVLSRWLGVRAQFDAGWNHPLSSIIDHGSMSYRYSVGPAFHFGPQLRHSKP